MTSKATNKIAHMLPIVGHVELLLYPPADRIHSVLLSHQERRRLDQLRHLGSFTHAFPGTRHMRWDYTVAMLYYASLIKGAGANSSFRIGSMEYSSLTSALQCCCLVWNIGHLPGTFAVEKGVYQYLHSQNASKPASSLLWPGEDNPRVQKIAEQANALLRDDDYLAVARVLAILKLLHYAKGEEEWLFDWVAEFAAPFMLGYEDRASLQWHKIGTVFPLVRHTAHLTVDHGISGLGWIPDIPALVKWIVSLSPPFETMRDTISELLSPVERQICDRLYHSEPARKESAIVSDHVHRYLNGKSNASKTIMRWLHESAFRRLKLGRITPLQECQVAASLRLRSHFSVPTRSVVDIEKELRSKHFDLPIGLEYRSWNSDVMAEPDELIIDVMTTDTPKTTDVGKLLAWCIRRFEDFSAKPQDDFSILRKIELESTYADLLMRAFKLSRPEIAMRFQPWPLAQFGIFKDFLESTARGGLWASNATMDDPITKHIVRDRSSDVPSRLRANYIEMQGVIHLRQLLRRRWTSSKPRQRCILVMGSVRFSNKERDLLEFDGGILTVSCRGGRMEWYGLESKSGDTDPKYVLEGKLNGVGINAPVVAIASKHAYMRMSL
jgi:hypothetical protein